MHQGSNTVERSAQTLLMYSVGGGLGSVPDAHWDGPLPAFAEWGLTVTSWWCCYHCVCVQDLPNYAQSQIPIFSLPQEWLWCESWCGNKTKTKVGV